MPQLYVPGDDVKFYVSPLHMRNFGFCFLWFEKFGFSIPNYVIARHPYAKHEVKWFPFPVQYENRGFVFTIMLCQALFCRRLSEVTNHLFLGL
jgi:hypothetical protein